MNEAKVKAAFVTHLRSTFKRAVVLRHEDQYTAGIPDISISMDGKTAWLEVKYLFSKTGKKAIRTKGVQHKTITNLSKQGTLAAYILFNETLEQRMTAIVLPDEVFEWWKSATEIYPGFNYNGVCDWLCGQLMWVI